MFGHTETSILGLTMTEIIGIEAAPTIRPQIDRILRDRCAASDKRKLPDDAAGPRSIDVDLLPHLDDTGEVVGAFVLINEQCRLARRDLPVAQRGNAFLRAHTKKPHASRATTWPRSEMAFSTAVGKEGCPGKPG